MTRTPLAAPAVALALALALALAFALVGGPPSPAAAADLDRVYAPLGAVPPPGLVPAPRGPAEVVVVPAQDPDVLGDPALVVERPVGAVRLPPPPRVGGAFLYVPGLNGPTGPPAYPLLPFAFGYGY